MLEDLLLSHPSVSDACVIGKPDPIAGELPFAYVVPVKGAKGVCAGYNGLRGQ